MGVNFTFKVICNKRLGLWSILGPAFIFIATSFTDHSDRDIRIKQMNIVIRQIGHLLLLQAGDSTSRVMPVTEIKKGTFQLRFENEFVFNHDSLMALSKGLLPKTQFPSGYTVTVHDCRTGGIVYGFQLNNNSPDMLACRGRSQPAGCYTIEFAFPDFYEDIKEQKADGEQSPESVNVKPQDANSKHEESKASTPGPEIDQQTEELMPGEVDSPQRDPKLKDLKTKTADSPSINLVYGGILVLLAVTLLIGGYKKILKPASVSDQELVLIQDYTIIQDHAKLPNPAEIQDQAIIPGNGIKQDQVITAEIVPELPSLGKFLFNVKDQRLILGSEVINLSDKECKLLDLLHKKFGELIPRETLMDEVWIKEGVITSRSLDMFVSKLRKKLSPDPELRITNIHGKGYKLEIPG